MQAVTIDYPDEMRLAAAITFYETGRLSSGRAAALAGISRVQFLHALQHYGVPSFTLSETELLDDIANARPR